MRIISTPNYAPQSNSLSNSKQNNCNITKSLRQNNSVAFGASLPKTTKVSEFFYNLFFGKRKVLAETRAIKDFETIKLLTKENAELKNKIKMKQTEELRAYLGQSVDDVKKEVNALTEDAKLLIKKAPEFKIEAINRVKAILEEFGINYNCKTHYENASFPEQIKQINNKKVLESRKHPGESLAIETIDDYSGISPTIVYRNINKDAKINEAQFELRLNGEFHAGTITTPKTIFNYDYMGYAGLITDFQKRGRFTESVVRFDDFNKISDIEQKYVNGNSVVERSVQYKDDVPVRLDECSDLTEEKNIWIDLT